MMWTNSIVTDRKSSAIHSDPAVGFFPVPIPDPSFEQLPRVFPREVIVEHDDLGHLEAGTVPVGSA
jgi:hypothetical protein